MITISNLTKKYGDKYALNDISFEVKKGEILGFLGPNGAGKSTTMNIITGYISATGGTVTVDGYDIANDPIEVKKRIGYLPEIPPVYPDMTVRAYLDFVCELKKVKKSEKSEHIYKVLETVRIKDVEKRKIGNLSKGYRQRVGLAGALIGEPEVLILDEPTVGLDPKQTAEVRNVIKQLGKERTVIFSSHILSEVSAVCDRVIIINNGRLVAEDTPENLSGKIEGKRRIIITVMGDGRAAEDILRSFDDVSDVVCTSSKGDEYCFEFDTELRSDERKAIFFAFAEKGIPIVSQQVKELSLEEIFIKLTGKETDSGEGDIEKGV